MSLPPFLQGDNFGRPFVCFSGGSGQIKPTVRTLIAHLILAFAPSILTILAFSFLLPGIISQVNYLHTSPCSRLCFWCRGAENTSQNLHCTLPLRTPSFLRQNHCLCQDSAQATLLYSKISTAALKDYCKDIPDSVQVKGQGVFQFFSSHFYRKEN